MTKVRNREHSYSAVYHKPWHVVLSRDVRFTEPIISHTLKLHSLFYVKNVIMKTCSYFIFHFDVTGFYMLQGRCNLGLYRCITKHVSYIQWSVIQIVQNSRSEKICLHLLEYLVCQVCCPTTNLIFRDHSSTHISSTRPYPLLQLANNH